MVDESPPQFLSLFSYKDEEEAPPEKVVMFSVRMPESVVNTLRRLARLNRRTLGMQTLIVIEKGLKSIQGTPPAD